MRVTCLAALAAIIALSACSSDDTASGSASGNGVGGPGAGQYGAGGPGAAGQGAPGSQADLANNVGDRVYFNFNQTQLTPQAMATLDQQAAWLAKYPQDSVQIAGNCDERGTEEYNVVLGNRRANAVVRYLQTRGVAPTRMSATSFGKDRPAALGSNEQAWAQNRNAITSVR